MPAFDVSDATTLEDQAAAIEAWQRDLALREQGLRAAAESTAGVCTNCGERCRLPAVYCDADCRADHERRRRVLARQGGHG